MNVPFHNEFDETFRSDRSVWLKIGGCALVTTFLVLFGTIRGVRQGSLAIELTIPLISGLTVFSCLLGAMLGLILSLKDAVDRRIERGDPVNSIFRLYFGRRNVSLAAWFVTIIFLTMVVSVVGSMMGLI